MTQATVFDRLRIVDDDMVSPAYLRKRATDGIDTLPPAVMVRAADTVDRLVDKVCAAEQAGNGWRAMATVLFGMLVESYNACEVEYNASLRALNPCNPSPVNPVPGAGGEDEPDLAYLWRLVFWQALAHKMNERSLMQQRGRAEHFTSWLAQFDVALGALLVQIGANVHPLIADEARRLRAQYDVIMAHMRKPVEEMVYVRCSVTPCSTIVGVNAVSVATPHDPESLRAAFEAAMVDPDRPLCDAHRRAGS